ncbi:Protein kinase C-like, phorbol ester/diacylglycerol binding protein [Gossypium australe]|uniref:Protein kinase C-like, phorbol ester/diacylglycerol binding protein n=1 Tax=Gossypium australe TaxID=47621 RepID=A0A5B6WLN3_9ROSI|nr:Protein kinase C-like, phorbol ester/diacylglycerol binding protein [Gossypium australe]
MKSAFCCNPSSKGFHDMVTEFPTHSSIGNMRSNLGNAKFAMRSWYDIVDDELEETGELLKNSAFVVIRETKLGENIVINTEIKHLSHHHNLIFSYDVEGDRYCDSCMLFISTSFYHCTQCDFFLHKSCVELPKKMYNWDIFTNVPSPLISMRCGFEFNNCFSYDCNLCEDYNCVPCLQISDTSTCQGHEHCLFFYEKYEGQCNCCGSNLKHAYACKECNFAVEYRCLRLRDKIQHKCDEHPLMLTYGEDNIYSGYHYCDICEQIRNPSHWFYHCVICDYSVHRNCVIDAYSYMKLGKTYTAKDHSLSLKSSMISLLNAIYVISNAKTYQPANKTFGARKSVRAIQVSNDLSLRKFKLVMDLSSRKFEPEKVRVSIAPKAVTDTDLVRA